MEELELLKRLEADADFEQPLRRVSYEPGMMLGFEALREEQDYHRRRLSRHQRWLHGAGTVAGLCVTRTPAPTDPDAGTKAVELRVSPGLAIDGLGREVVVRETWCLDLAGWLQAAREKLADVLPAGFFGGRLALTVTVRHETCASGLAPKLATELNAGTDAVGPARYADEARIELLIADAATRNPSAPRVPPPYDACDPALATAAFTSESGGWRADWSNGLPASELAELRRRAWLVRLFSGEHSSVGPVAVDVDRPTVDALHALARIPLAWVDITAADFAHLSVRPERVFVDNLIRPFVPTAFHADLRV